MGTKLQMLLSATLISACGASKSNPMPTAADTGAQASPSPAASSSAPDVSGLMLNDPSAAGQLITTYIDGGVGDANSENEGSATSLSLVGTDKEVQMDRSRICTVTGATAVVDLEASLTVDRILSLPVRSFETKFEAYSDRTRTWSMDGGNVACAADGKSAEISVANIAGISLAATIKEERSRTNSLTNKRSGKTLAQSFKFERDGTRQITWKAVNLASGTYTIDKESTHQFQNTLQVTKIDGSSLSLSSTEATLAGAPLEISVLRDQTSLEVTGRTIHSGTLEATHADGSRIDTVFKEVVYSATASDKCMPMSGEIDGSVFASGSTTPSLTYTLVFSAQDGEITFSNGATVDFSPEGCDFDDPTDKAVDTAKGNVTPPSDVTPTAPTATATAAATGTATGS